MASEGARPAGARGGTPVPGSAAMAAAELERLRMAGAGMAIAVLTSGGDAQGEAPRSGRRRRASPPGSPAGRRGCGGSVVLAAAGACGDVLQGRGDVWTRGVGRGKIMGVWGRGASGWAPGGSGGSPPDAAMSPRCHVSPPQA